MNPSFEETFRTQYPALHRYLCRRVGAATADDLAAATFTIAYENWESLDPALTAKPWLYGIASNLMRRHWRTERRMLRAWARSGVDPVAHDESDEISARVDAGVATRVLADALAKLRPKDRDLLLLSAWAELSDREIGAALELPIGTVKSRLSRAKARLRHQLDSYDRPAPRPSIHPLTKEPS